ncbi:MAG: hypothetical protein ACP5XB_30935 [Isosphaeraceae bacterium]
MEITVSPSYFCPHCHALIRAGEDLWQGWLRCPRCDRPGLPPQPARVLKSPRHPASPLPPPGQESSKKIDGLLDEPAALVHPAGIAPAPGPVSTAPRLIVTTGLFVSLFLLFNGYLDRSVQSMSLFGTLAVVFLIVLLRMKLAGGRG